MSRRLQIGLFACGALVVASAAVLAPTAGCTVLTNDAPLDDAGVYDGAADAPSNACPACVADQCAGEWALCLTDPSCRAVRTCDSVSAMAACVCALGTVDGGDAGTPGLAAYQAFASCNDVRACTACPATCSGVCSDAGRKTTFTGRCADGGADADAGADDGGADAAPPVTAGGCAGCISGKCGDPKKLCAVGTECAAYLGCVYACHDEACANDCGQKHATGKAAAAALSSCTHAACSAACGL